MILKLLVAYILCEFLCAFLMERQQVLKLQSLYLSLSLIACPAGHFKMGSGPGPCSACPDSSHTGETGSASCVCRPGYHRAPTDSPDTPCTR